MSGLRVLRAGPAMTVQDLGRSGTLAFGLSRGGAADRQALYEGAALLGQGVECAALEMVGAGGVFEAERDLRIALTGAPMAARIDGRAVAWHASHDLPAGARLEIGAAQSGTYGYLHLGGGIDTPQVLGARAVHMVAGLGGPVHSGDHLPAGPDKGQGTGALLPVSDRFRGGEVRVVASLQTAFFDKNTLQRFEKTEFRRDPRANRMGVRLASDGPGFGVDGGLKVLSEVITSGDIQITGDGAPFVLMSESQTTGGYPRIATVLPCDLPIVAQAPVGASIRMRFVPLEDAVALHRRWMSELKTLKNRLQRLVRMPEEIDNLAEYQLISGVTSGDGAPMPETDT